MRREKARGVRAEPEERRMPERHDAGVAEDQIERYGEESRDEDLAAEDAVIRKDEEREHRKEPERDFEGRPAPVRKSGIPRTASDRQEHRPTDRTCLRLAGHRAPQGTR